MTYKYSYKIHQNIFIHIMREASVRQPSGNSLLIQIYSSTFINSHVFTHIGREVSVRQPNDKIHSSIFMYIHPKFIQMYSSALGEKWQQFIHPNMFIHTKRVMWVRPTIGVQEYVHSSRYLVKYIHPGFKIWPFAQIFTIYIHPNIHPNVWLVYSFIHTHPSIEYIYSSKYWLYIFVFIHIFIIIFATVPLVGRPGLYTSSHWSPCSASIGCPALTTSSSPSIASWFWLLWDIIDTKWLNW